MQNDGKSDFGRTKRAELIQWTHHMIEPPKDRSPGSEITPLDLAMRGLIGVPKPEIKAAEKQYRIQRRRARRAAKQPKKR
jgi:hypothetical protein